MALSKQYGRVEVSGLEDDEPVLIVAARDAAANETIRDYASIAEEKGASASFVKDSLELADDAVRWQVDHPDLVRVPGPREESGGDDDEA